MNLAGPSIIRHGVDDGIARSSTSGLLGSTLLFLGCCLAGWFTFRALILVTTRTAQRILLRAAGAGLRAAAAARPRLLREGDGRADHDPHDVGHRGAPAAAPERAHQRTRRRRHVHRVRGNPPGDERQARPGDDRGGAAARLPQPLVPAALGRRLPRRPREGGDGQRPVPGGTVRRARRPGLRPRGPQRRRLRGDGARAARRPAPHGVAGVGVLPAGRVPVDGGHRRRARLRRVAHRRRLADDRRPRRLRALPRPGVLADPAAVAGLRDLPAGQGGHDEDPRPAHDTGHRAGARGPRRRSPTDARPGRSASTPSASPTTTRAPRRCRASTSRSSPARRSPSSARRAPASRRS